MIVIPRANPLRFVRFDNYGQGLPNYDNQLHYDQQFGAAWSKAFYVQKFQTGKSIEIQLTTDMTVTAELLDENFDTVATLSPQVKLTYPDNKTKVYHYNIGSSGLSGRYIVSLEFAETGLKSQQYVSEWFQVGNFPDLVYLRWHGSDTDGILWDASINFGFSVEAYFEPITSAEIEDAENYDNSPINLRGQNIRMFNFEAIPLPNFMAEKLAIAMAHESVYLNDVECVCKDDSDQEPLGNGLVEFKQKLYQKNYENYITFVEAEQTEPSESGFNWLYTNDEEDTVLIDENTNALIY